MIPLIDVNILYFINSFITTIKLTNNGVCMEFFTESAFQGLLTEAGTPLNYASAKSAEKSALADDTWTFSTGSQNLGIRAHTMTKGKIRSYKQSAQPTIVHMFSVNNAGKTSPKVMKIKKPFAVVATVASIVSSIVKENKAGSLILLRIPSTMGQADTVAALMQRYIKKEGLTGWRAGRALNVDGKKINYITMGKVSKAKDWTFEMVFGVKADIKKYPKGIKLINVSPAKEKTPEQVEKEVELMAELERNAKEAETKLAPKLKASVPKKIDITGVAGFEDTPEEVIQFNRENPNPIVKNPNKERAELDIHAEIFKGDVLSDMYDATPQKEVVETVILQSITNNTYASKDELEILASDDQKHFANYIAKTKLTWREITNGTQKWEDLKATFVMAAEKGLITPSPYINNNPKLQTPEYIAEYALGKWLDKQYGQGLSIRLLDSYKQYNGDHIKKSHRDIVKSYCGSGYQKINGFLLNGSDVGESYKNAVKKLDTAFNGSGIRVPKDLILYRSMYMRDSTLIDTLTHKIFHFRTYVSTSISPLKGYSFNGPGLSTLSAVRDADIDENAPMNMSPSVTFDIHNAYKVPAIVPGNVSPHIPEIEVILPRGLTLKINRAAARGENQMSSAHLYTEVLSNDEISVNEAVYDGNYLMETGKLKLMKFGECETLTESIMRKPTKQMLAAQEMLFLTAQGARTRVMEGTDFDAKVEMVRAEEKFANNVG